MVDMSTLPTVELGVLGPLQVRQGGAPVTIPGAKPRAILTMLGLHGGSIVSADTLVELLWGEDPPRTAAKALQTHISSLRRTLGDGVVVTEGAGWTLQGTSIDATRYKSTAKSARDAAAVGDSSQAVARFEEALTLWRGVPELPDGRRGLSEKTRWIEGHAALVEDRADALLATGRAAEVIGDLEAAVSEAPLRERRWGQLMLALYRAGRQGEALGAYQRARSLLAEELGVDPGPELRRLEAAIVAQDGSLDTPAAQQLPSVTRAVTFLLTDIEGSTTAWETEAEIMATALARHDEIVEQIVTSRGGRLIKTRGEGDATFSVFERPSAAAAAAIELQDAIGHEPWALREPMQIRVALHTGEAELRDGDYFGRAVNRAARLRSLAGGAQILCSGATAELIIDSLPDDVVLSDLGMRQLRNLPRPEHVFELRLESVDDVPQPQAGEAPVERPGLPAVLVGPGPFVGRGRELERLYSAWQNARTGGTNAVLIAGEPGVGKTRLAGEWSRQAYDQGALVIYGRCDEDLGAPYQPFAEALRSLVPCLGAGRLRGLRGVEALLPLVPGLSDVLPDLAAPTRADPDTERYALFDAVVALLEIACASVPLVLILDDLHWAAKPTLLLLRHLLRFGDRASVQIVGTYRSTDLDRSHPLAAMLADLHRDGTADRLNLSGLDEADVTTYVAEAGYDDEELAHALASVTGGNPFFLIEALRHVDESGGVWDQSTLPQGVREAVSRRLSRLTLEANKALGAAAVVGSRFALELVERVVEGDLIDVFDEACKAGIVIEEPGGRYRFNHALVRQSLLAELPSVRRMRLHQRIATTLENEPGADDELLAELAHHYFECAWAGNASKAVFYCRRAADQAMARLAYEGAAELYDRAFHALEEIDDELPDRDDQTAELLIARCEALLAAGDVTTAAGAIPQLQSATVDSARLAAWATCFDGQLSMLTQPERLDEVETAVGAAAGKLAELDDAAGEAMAHTVRAGCLARLGRIGDCEIALDDALTAARRAREHRRVNAVLAGAPLAALWGPNPVPRAGGRCLDVVRLLRITTDSPAVEATSTRCQAVLEAFRGRAAAARRMIDSARRTVTELGLRHAVLEVEHYAGIVELVIDDPAAAEAHFRLAYNGFRRMRLDADTAETAALLGGACLALGRDDEADELCTESERLAGHAQKASTSWRTLRAQLLSRGGHHDEARRVAEEAVGLVERSDALVDHGDACLSLAWVLGNAGDVVGARAAAERAAHLYEQKGAAALVERARRILGEQAARPVAPEPEPPSSEVTNACAQAGSRLVSAVNREAWDEVTQLLASSVSVESRRKIVGFQRIDVPSSQWPDDMRRYLEAGMVRYRQTLVAMRGDRFALFRLELGTSDPSSGAPQDEMLQVAGLDQEGRIALQVKFDVEDIEAALAELDARYARFEKAHPAAGRLENTAALVFENIWSHVAAGDWDAVAAKSSDNLSVIDHRRVVNAGTLVGRDAVIEDLQAATGVGFTITMLSAIAIRGERLVLARVRAAGRDPEVIQNDAFNVVEIDADQRLTAVIVFDLDDFDAAVAELDARYLAGEATAHARTWSVIAGTYAMFNRHESAPADWAIVDHRRGSPFAPGDLTPALRTFFDLTPVFAIHIETVHRLSSSGAVITCDSRGSSQEGLNVEWRMIQIVMVEGDRLTRCELFDETDLDVAIPRFEQLERSAPGLENAASQVTERFLGYFAARDWDAFANLLADDISTEDRRRVVNAGVRQDRDAELKDFRSAADLGVRSVTSNVVATRGKHLVLNRSRLSRSDEEPEPFHVDLLWLIEIDASHQITAWVTFDPDAFEAAVAELDARFLAGEAAAHVQTWSVIVQAYDALNRREMPPTTPDWVNIDHRRHGSAFGPGELPALLSSWTLASDVNSCIDVVHRLDNLGAVISSVTHETSQEGFKAEWRSIAVLKVKCDQVDRLEVFDEADLGVAIARFEEMHPQTRGLENNATRVFEHVWSHIAARNWDTVADTVAENYFAIDHRRVVNAGIQQGRAAVIQGLQAATDVGMAISMVSAMAIRGERLVLARVRASGRDPETSQNDALCLVEIDANERIAVVVVYDLEDFDTAIAELDTRYLAGEAAEYSQTWSVIVDAFAKLNRHEIPVIAPDWVTVDHRPVIAMGLHDLVTFLQTAWDAMPGLTIYIEIVHQLSNRGAVLTHAAHWTSQEGFDAEWRMIELLTVEGGILTSGQIFAEADLDAALARFAELHPRTRRLENAATQVYDRLNTYFAIRDWASIATMLVDDVFTEDRRRVVNAGLRRGRDAVVAELSGFAEIGVTKVMSEIIAIRGGRLALTHTRSSGVDQRPQAFRSEVLHVFEIDSHQQVTATIVFDVDDIDTAFEELDARYLADEAAGHTRTFSLVAAAFATLNERRLPATASDWVNIDHRRLAPMGAGDLAAYLDVSWELSPQAAMYIAAVHRLSIFGAVVSHVAIGTSQEGFDAEWRVIDVLIFDGELISRCELFDETDLDAALARFDQLSLPVSRLENAASQVYDRLKGFFATHDWAAVSETLSDDVLSDDRRRALNSGIRRGRDAAIQDARAMAELWIATVVSTVIAIRGTRLALMRARYSGQSLDAEGYIAEVLNLIEIDDHGQVVARIWFDANDVDAAFQELDARYLAGEAAAHAHTWLISRRAHAEWNRHRVPPTTDDWVSIDHRRGRAFAPGDMIPFLQATWEFLPDVRVRTETVHRLSDIGVVVTEAANGTSQDGFAAEWREVILITFEGEKISRCELFDEEDLDTAIARFDELQPQARMQNAASQLEQRFLTCFAARDWETMAELLADEFSMDDRRHVVNAGVRHGREAEIANQRAVADVGVTHLTPTVMAIRGARLALGRYSVFGSWSGSDVLCVSEINAENQIAARVAFDPDDIDAAFEELESRFTAGEGAPYRQAWSVITAGYAALNRHEVPSTTPDWVNVDHRRGIAYASGELAPYIRATFYVAPNIKIRIEVVHRLTTFGAVISYSGHGTSQEGFDAVWRETAVFTVDGDLVSRCEMYDAADLDAALARFEELQPRVRKLENAASRADDRFFAYFGARNWGAISEILAEGGFVDDRRRTVNAGFWDGRDAVIANMRALAVDGGANTTLTVVATRGEHLALTRICTSNRDLRHGEFGVELLSVAETDNVDRIVARIIFGSNDTEAAFTELDARYLAGEGAAHAQTWTRVARAYAALNRRELPATTPNWVNIDHRRLAPIADGDLGAYLLATWDLSPQSGIYIEAVHRLDNTGAVVTQVVNGTSQQGFAAEWRTIDLTTYEGDRINRCELFDEADLDTALARIEELQPQTRPLGNTASAKHSRLTACVATRDWNALSEILADDIKIDDRRRVVNSGITSGRDAAIADMSGVLDVGLTNISSTVIATRGDRLDLCRTCVSGQDRPEAFQIEFFSVVEIDANERIAARVLFDADGFGAAFMELESRYLAGEAADYSDTWSVIAKAFAGFTRNELPPTTQDPVYIDHRPLVSIEGADMAASIRALLDLTSEVSVYIEAVHRLSALGAVTTQVLKGTWQEGSEAEAWMIAMFTVEGNLISGVEVFDEADLDAALVRFDELNQPPTENGVTQS